MGTPDSCASRSSVGPSKENRPCSLRPFFVSKSRVRSTRTLCAPSDVGTQRYHCNAGNDRGNYHGDAIVEMMRHDEPQQQKGNYDEDYGPHQQPEQLLTDRGL